MVQLTTVGPSDRQIPDNADDVRHRGTATRWGTIPRLLESLATADVVESPRLGVIDLSIENS